MYKIQIGYEDGYYVAYLVKQTELLTQATIEEELTDFSLDSLIFSIPQRWKDMLTCFENN